MLFQDRVAIPLLLTPVAINSIITMKIYCLLLIFLTADILSGAAETNKLYMTDERQLSVGWQFISSKQLEATKKRREALPAKDFPEGNWGEPFHGFQLSLRFSKNTYTNGEEIAAILLLRNITNHYMSWASGVAKDIGAIDLAVTTETGQAIDPRPKAPVPAGMPTVSYAGPSGSIAPLTQTKFLETLNKKYDLTNGTYLVQASLPYPLVKRRSPDGKPLELEWKQVTSARVPIKIESSP